MNYLDIIIAIVLFLFGFKGYRKGLIIEVVTLLAFGVGIYGAMHFSDFTAAHLQEVMEINPKYLNTIAFVLTFILLVIVVNLIGRAMTNIIHFMQAVDQVVPGFAGDETLLYSPELKFYSNRVKMDEHLTTNIQGLFCLGDSSGWTRGLMMASVMGTLMGRKLVEQEG